MKKLVVFTGAGISAESGIKTFRGSDGLWENHRIEDVACPEAWRKNPELVIRFYNERRNNILKAIPNAAHTAVAELEAHFDVTVITQNIDDLHERAGSTKVLHLHGEIIKMRSEHNEQLVYDIRKDMVYGDKAEDGSYLRPHIVWFGESVPAMSKAIDIAQSADVFAVVGTSLLVYPAASLVEYVRATTPVYLIDNNAPKIRMKNVHIIEKVASEGMLDLKNILLSNYIRTN